ncbi:MAG: response regulator transcription factor [Vicingus serpentipes]|nr:response regulator transcription factor [Vicingus serpentipes]
MKLNKTIDVLIVDDNSSIRSSFRVFLNNIPNINIVGECSDGGEVIPFLEKNKVDIVFIDVIMKFIDGFEATENIKKYYPHIKVIAFSSLDHYSFRKRMKESGADGFISKFDVNEEQIVSELKKIM